MQPTSLDLRVHPDVKMALPLDDVALLLRENSATPLKLSGVSAQLAQRMVEGTSMAALLSLLVQHHPQATAEQCQQALQSFLSRLRRAGMMNEGSDSPVNVPGRYRLPNPDGIAQQLASIMHCFPRRAGYTLLMLLLALAVYSMTSSLPVLNAWLTQGDLHGMQLAILVVGLPAWLILHELSHAVVCRLYGCPVLGAGLQFRGWWLPSAFVNTSAIALFPQPKIKVSVALAGPVMDLFCLGLIASLSQTALGSSVLPLQLVLLCGLLINLTPFRLSDATRAFQAFAQPGATPGSMIWSTRGRRTYRSYCVLYALLLTTVFVWISFSSWQRMANWVNSGMAS